MLEYLNLPLEFISGKTFNDLNVYYTGLLVISIPDKIWT